jgi:hypothetical protein
MIDFDTIDAERLYRTVHELQGIKDPVTNPGALDAAADYLVRRMEEAGLAVRMHYFELDGCERPFRNIEGRLGPVDHCPAAVVMAHYDTVAGSPGANDDAIGVAAMLEVARALAALPEPPPVYFVASTLEEQHPVIAAAERVAAARLGILDERDRYTSWTIGESCKSIKQRARALFNGGMLYDAAFAAALAEAEAVPATVTDFFREIGPLHAGISVGNAAGRLNRIGSSLWLAEALTRGSQLAFNITLDEIGTYNYSEGSQNTIDGIDIYPFMAERHRVEPDKRIADFLLIVADQNSGQLGAAFMSNARLAGIDLPAALVVLPMDYEAIVAQLPMALNSDHAAFWRAHIPAIFCFDTSLGRNPFCHSMADCIEILDFDKVRDVSRTVAATLADRALY